MVRILFALAAAHLLAAAPHSEPEIPDFQASTERFADAAGCSAHMSSLVAAARAAGSAAAEGPYDVEAGDVRAHIVTAEGRGHRIAEYRCLAEQLSARSWTHSIAALQEEEFTIESVARRAPWFQHGGRE